MATAALSKSSAGALSKYDPRKGTEKVAWLAAAEKHFAKAKDATKLQQAIRAKLEAQAEFVYWWDTQVEKQQGRPSKKSLSDPKGFRAGKDGLPDSVTIHRWRSKLNDPGKFEETYEATFAKYTKLLEFSSTAHVAKNSGENEWYSPAEYVESARSVMGDIELDPASHDAANDVIKAEQIFTSDDDGLTKSWHGRVWMNPPYAQPLIGQFCEKLSASVRDGQVPEAVVLVNNATETQWFRALVDVASAVCFPTGRVRFWHPGRPNAAPLQGQAVVYIGPNVEKFRQSFMAFGWTATL